MGELRLIERATMLEPVLLDIIAEACTAGKSARYNRIKTYIHLRDWASHYVGWYARKPELRTADYYDAIIGLVSALLPEDEVDKQS